VYAAAVLRAARPVVEISPLVAATDDRDGSVVPIEELRAAFRPLH
jgi:hypothetical protein